MRRRVPIAVAILGSLLAACAPAPLTDDPVRAEFIEACEGRVENRSMAPRKRTAYCECGYDRTMSGLSEEERQIARFYLLSQVGVDVRSRSFVTRDNLHAATKVSAAIGSAAQRCR